MAELNCQPSSNEETGLACFCELVTIFQIKLGLRNVSRVSEIEQPIEEYDSRCDSCVEANKECSCKKDVTNRVEFVILNENSVNGTSSVFSSVLNMTGMLIGLGLLSIPYALENGGWTSAFMLVGTGILCAYTAHLLGKCMNENPNLKTYQDIGAQAFGTKGRVIVSIFIYLEIFFSLVSYTISLSDNLPLALPGVHLALPHLDIPTAHLLTIIAILIALPGLWLRDLSSISFLSFGGIMMSLLIFFTVLWTAVFGHLDANQYIPVFQWENTFLVFGLYFFSYAGHVIFPSIRTSMKDPSKFTKVTIISFTLVTTLFISLAFTGAKLFGPTVNAQVTLSMPPHQVATKLALWAAVLTPMTKYALNIAPFTIQLESHLPSSMGDRTKMLICGIAGSVLLIVILILALTVPFFQYVTSLTGSMVSVGIVIIFPCAFYLRICGEQITRDDVVMHWMIIALGVDIAVCGTLSSADYLVQSFQKGTLV